MRRPFIAGNWKMHLDKQAVNSFCDSLRASSHSDGVTVGVFPPFVYLAHVVEALAGTDIVVGAQTCRPEEHGAFTGEVAAVQVKDVGASHVLVGHSERRHVMGETDVEIRARLDAALACGLDVVLCVGETLEEREAERTGEVVLGQLDSGVTGLDGGELVSRVTIAYEPVWAIGTGLTATPEQAQEVHAMIRSRLATAFSDEISQGVIIQYGGSVKPANVEALMSCPDVDGALVGGASLAYESFAQLIEFNT
ncbi:MAG: triose-phosphate isomerase [Planctomycetota bacterium]|jgi:triosephosphate isomerase (TIM)|nr:triose-phosphate isomerase [Planctomycetota bacterium]